MEEFTIYLVSNGSMEIFPENTLSAFTNLLAEPLSLQGEWRVALCEIKTPALVKNVVDTKFTSKKGLPLSSELQGWTTRGSYVIEGGVYHDVTELLTKLRTLSATNLKWEINPVNHKLSITFDVGDGFSFPTKEIPNLLGFKGIAVKIFGLDGTHIGHQQFVKEVGSEKANKKSTFTLVGEYPVDLTGGKHLIFVYINIIEYQTVADTKAPLLRLLSADTRLRNWVISETQTLSARAFKHLEYKNLISNNIKTIKVELRNESGDLVPFIGSGRTTLTLKFQKVS